jgi:hypothetical protein
MVYMVESVISDELAFGGVGPTELKPADIRVGACVAARPHG